MFVDLFHTKKLRLALIYAAVAILVQFLQDTLFARMTVFGTHMLFVPGVCAAVGFQEGGFRGGLYGLLAGILCDMTFAENTVMFTVLFPILGFVSGLAAEFLMNRSYPGFLVTAVACMLLTGLTQMLPVLALQPGALFHCVLTVILQTLVSIPVVALLYFPIEQISGRFRA